MIDEGQLRAYIVTQIEHIKKHGCSGIKCKRCALNNICDRNAKNSKELAHKVAAYAQVENGKKL